MEALNLPHTLPKELSSLPMANHLQQVVSLLQNHPVIIVTGETGSGKSTVLAEGLSSHFNKVISGQPRILATTSLAKFLAQTRGEEVGNSVGYKTALEQAYSTATKVMFSTHGFTAEQELSESSIEDSPETVIILDECHVESSDMETLAGLLLMRIRNGAKFKLVFCSATVNSEQIKKRVEELLDKIVPQVYISQRLYKVKRHYIKPDALIPQAVSCAEEGKNILIFQPTVKMVETCILALKRRNTNAEILPLYAALSTEEKDRALRTDYGRPKIVVATNIAEASITIPDINVVIESGLELKLAVDTEGAPCLTLRLKPAANVLQAIGRCGRTQPGEAYIAGVRIKDRRPYPEAAINNEPIERTALRLVCMGLKPENLCWLTPPHKAHYQNALKSLEALGAIKKDGNNHTATPLGVAMAKYPVSPTFARALCAAKELGILEMALLVVATMAQSHKLLFDPINNYEYGPWLKGEKSTFWVNYQVFMDLYIQIQEEEIPPEEEENWLIERGIAPHEYVNIKNIYTLMCEREGVTPYGPDALQNSPQMKEAITKCLIAGLWPLGVRWHYQGIIFHGTMSSRKLHKQGIALPDSSIVIGSPFGFADDYGARRNLVHPIVVTQQLLQAALPAEEYIQVLKDIDAAKNVAKQHRRAASHTVPRIAVPTHSNKAKRKKPRDKKRKNKRCR